MVEYGRGNDPERMPLTPQDYVMQIRGYFEDVVEQPEFQTWQTALDDVMELRKLDEQKSGIIIKTDEPVTVWSRAEKAKAALLSQWKREDAKLKCANATYKFAFQLMSITAMNLECAYQQEGNKNPIQAADKELEELKEYITRL
jgi:hypothetical protein